MVSVKMKQNNVFHFENFIIKKMTKDTIILISIIIQINKYFTRGSFWKKKKWKNGVLIKNLLLLSKL